MTRSTRKYRWRTLLLLSGLMAWLGVPCAPAFAAGENLVANPDAETGNLEGWTGLGFGVAAYGSSPNVPSQAVAAYDGLGSWLFLGEQSETKLTQTVSLAGLTAAIEEGHEPLSVQADLGGAGSETDGMELLMQPQGASGEALGPPVQLGPPTATDRKDEVTMLLCSATITAPVGTRSALITLLAVGNPGATTASADNIQLFDGELATTTILYSGPPPEGPNCHHRIILLPEPKPSSPPPPSSSGSSPCASNARLATAAPPGTTPAAQPPPNPCDVNGQGAVSVSRIRLTSGHLSLRMSGAGTVDVVIARESRIAMHAKRSTHSIWRKILRFSLHATAAGLVDHSFHRLGPGQYRVTANVVGSARPIAMTTRLRAG